MLGCCRALQPRWQTIEDRHGISDASHGTRFTDAWATARERLAKIAARGNIVTVAKHIPLVYFTVTGYGGAAMIIGPDDLHEYVELPALTTEGLRDRSEEVISKGVDHIEKRLRARAQPPTSTERGAGRCGMGSPADSRCDSPMAMGRGDGPSARPGPTSVADDDSSGGTACRVATSCGLDCR